MKILIAVDESRQSMASLDFLARFPFKEPPEVIIAHVCPVEDLHDLGSAVPPLIQASVDEYRIRAQRLLEKTAGRCPKWFKTIETELLVGHSAREIVKAAESVDISLKT